MTSESCLFPDYLDKLAVQLGTASLWCQ